MGVNLIEALKKWDKVTNDGGKTIYSTNKEGTIVMHRCGAGGGFKPTLELFNSTGWTRAEEPLKLPERQKKYLMFHFIDEFGDVVTTSEFPSNANDILYDNTNHFLDKELAQYVADKQLIQRLNIVLGIVNKDVENKEILISRYILDKYKDVIIRIRQYEDKEGI